MTRCPTPAKAAYPNPAAARLEADRIRCDRGGPALEPYRCCCGSWHLTSNSSLTSRIRGALRKD